MISWRKWNTCYNLYYIVHNNIEIIWSAFSTSRYYDSICRDKFLVNDT